MDYSFDEPTDTRELEELVLILENNEHSIVHIENPQNQNKIDKIRCLVGEHKARACWLDCLELFNFNQLFGTILNKLFKPELDLDGTTEFDSDYLDNMNVNSYQNFIDRIQKRMKKIQHKNQIVVLQDADVLAKLNTEYIQFLTKINHLIPGLKFTVLLISRFKLDHFTRLGIRFGKVYSIEFRPYSLDEIKALIVTSKPDEFPIGCYSK